MHVLFLLQGLPDHFTGGIRLLQQKFSMAQPVHDGFLIVGQVTL